MTEVELELTYLAKPTLTSPMGLRTTTIKRYNYSNGHKSS